MELAAVPVQMLHNSISKEIEETLTPEQLNKYREVQIQISGGEINHPGWFEPLDLTDEQRAELDAIHKERETEMNRLLDEDTELHLERLRKIQDDMKEQTKNNPTISNDEFTQIFQKSQEKITKAEKAAPTFQEKQRSIRERRKNLSTKYKEKFMNVLTDEQLDKMQHIIDNTSEFVKKRFEKELGISKVSQPEEKSQADPWQPGPDSWKPGDGLPEEFKQQRKEGRFPQKKR